MSPTPSTTTFRLDGAGITGVRSATRAPGRHRNSELAHQPTSRANRSDSVKNNTPAADEALFYRARLILGDALPRPVR